MKPAYVLGAAVAVFMLARYIANRTTGTGN
jgi:hypothetical protein